MDVNCFIKRVLDPNVRTEGVQNSYGLRRVVSLNERDSLRVTLNRGILVHDTFVSKSKRIGLKEVTIPNRDENYPRMKEAEKDETSNWQKRSSRGFSSLFKGKSNNPFR